MRRDRVRVSPEGIFDGGQKVAELAAVVQQTPRGDIRGITDIPYSHSVRNVLIGVAVGVGALFGVLLALSGGD